jgi:hypothetical protein
MPNSLNRTSDSPVDKSNYSKGKIQPEPPVCGRDGSSDPLLLIASGIDYDPLPEGDTSEVHVYRTGEKITALTEDNIRAAAGLGFRAFQIPASDFFNRDLNPDGTADWSDLDENLKMLARLNMSAVIVAGYYWIPPCIEQSDSAVPISCLAHDESLPIFSLWNEFTYEWIERCVSALAGHLRNNPAFIEAIQIGVYGDYGEAMFPCGGTLYYPDSNNAISTKNLHNHPDFWCYDPCARADYIETLQNKKQSCKASRPLKNDIPDLFPSPPHEGNIDPDWFTFLQWYHNSMTRHIERTTAIFRKYFPTNKLSVFLGGGVEPHHHGQDNTALCKIARSSDVIIRSTASASQVLTRQVKELPIPLAAAFQRNYPIVKRISTACRFFDIPMWLETPYPPSLHGPELTVRLFELLSCGAVGCFEWNQTLKRQDYIFTKYKDMLLQDKPVVDVAIYFPVLSHRSKRDSLLPEKFWHSAARARTVTDYDIVDDLLIRSGVLERYSLLLMPEIDRVEHSLLEIIDKWVASGGIVLAQNCGPITLNGTEKTDERSWLGVAPSCEIKMESLTNKDDQNDFPLPTTRQNFQNIPVMSFDRLHENGEALLSTTSGTALVRRSLGAGMTLFCTAQDESAELFTCVLNDILTCWTATDHFVTRNSQRWVSGHEQVFATLLKHSTLLMNMSSESVLLCNQDRKVELAPYELARI